MRQFTISICRESEDVDLMIEVDTAKLPIHIKPHQLQSWVEGFIAALPPVTDR